MNTKESIPPGTVAYRRELFVTYLPEAYLYTPSHYWLAEVEPGLWRVGLTKFAVRMLGEMVDNGYQVKTGEVVHPGQVVGWIEGFKAVSDIYCVVDGHFEGENLDLQQQTTLLNLDPYGKGWLYQVKGRPDSTSVDVTGYQAILDATIDKLRE